MFNRLLKTQTGLETRPTMSPACMAGSRRDFVLGLIGLMTLAGCSSVPQVLSDEAVFGELDALYTAVTSKRRNLLTDCQKRITKLHDEQRMSDAGFKEVEAIIALAEQDKWTPAAERLYTFMRGQRKAN
ncbi:MAG: hypothetical protein JWN70_3912 [Planctomycetaceae bacterium]|nr:hypothetical protein [Planctomycetaceae bacterium]